MIIKPSNLALSRRQFIRNILPTGTLFCFGCGSFSALAGGQDIQKTEEMQHKFLEDSGLTIREVFRFAYQWTYIPMIETLATKMGREKVLEMVKEATGIYWAEWMRSVAQKLPKKDLAAFLSIGTAEPVIGSPERRKRFLSLANTGQRIENTPKSLELKIVECLWAQTFLEANAGDIGFASICYVDEAMAASFDQRLKLTRTTTLMKGDDCCHFRWAWEG